MTNREKGCGNACKPFSCFIGNWKRKELFLLYEENLL